MSDSRKKKPPPELADDGLIFMIYCKFFVNN